MEPREANFRNGASPTADHETGVARQSHEQIPRISHPARDENTAGPVLQSNVIGRHDTNHDASGSECTLCGDPSGRTPTTANQRDPEARKKFTCAGRQLKGARAGFGASQNAYLSAS